MKTKNYKGIFAFLAVLFCLVLACCVFFTACGGNEDEPSGDNPSGDNSGGDDTGDDDVDLPSSVTLQGTGTYNDGAMDAVVTMVINFDNMTATLEEIASEPAEESEDETSEDETVTVSEESESADESEDETEKGEDTSTSLLLVSSTSTGLAEGGINVGTGTVSMEVDEDDSVGFDSSTTTFSVVFTYNTSKTLAFTVTSDYSTSLYPLIEIGMLDGASLTGQTTRIEESDQTELNKTDENGNVTDVVYATETTIFTAIEFTNTSGLTISGSEAKIDIIIFLGMNEKAQVVENTETEPATEEVDAVDGANRVGNTEVWIGVAGSSSYTYGPDSNTDPDGLASSYVGLGSVKYLGSNGDEITSFTDANPLYSEEDTTEDGESVVAITVNESVASIEITFKDTSDLGSGIEFTLVATVEDGTWTLSVNSLLEYALLDPPTATLTAQTD